MKVSNLFYLYILLGLIFCPKVFSEIYTWNGIDGTDWNTSTNWTSAKPGEADTALFNTTVNTISNNVANQNIKSIS